MYVFFWYFLLAYSWCTILYITGVQYSESQFLNYASFIDLPTQRSNPGYPHCRQILFQLSFQGSHSFYQRLAISPCCVIYAPVSISASIFGKRNLQCILRKSPKDGVHVQSLANQSIKIFAHSEMLSLYAEVGRENCKRNRCDPWFKKVYNWNKR